MSTNPRTSRAAKPRKPTFLELLIQLSDCIRSCPKITQKGKSRMLWRLKRMRRKERAFEKACAASGA